MGKSRCISAGFIGFLTVKPVHVSSLRAQGPLSRSPVLSVQLGDCGPGSHLLGPPQKAALSGDPFFFHSSGGVNPPSGKKIPGRSREFCLDAPSGAARLRSQKRPGTDRAIPRLIRSAWRSQPWQPSARPSPKSYAFRGPLFLSFLGRSQSALRQKNSRPQPGILFGRAFRRGSLALAKEARDRQSDPPSYPFSLAIAALAAICSASFLLWPLPRPATSPFRSTSTKKRLSWSGPSSPVRRYFKTWPLSLWTSS